MFEGKTYWIVGASEGLGEALAKQLHQHGAQVILSARNKERLMGIATQLGEARVVPIDVTDPVSVNDAIQSVGEFDGFIYSVGQYEPVSAKSWKAEQVEMMCEANFMGAVRLLGQVVPNFVSHKKGHIVLIGSLAGHRGLPGAIGYGASKAALMHLGETIQVDLRDNPVRVQVINPGYIQTRLSSKNNFKMPMIQSPEQSAQRIIKAMQGRRLEVNFPAPFSFVFTIGKLIPKALFWRLF